MENPPNSIDQTNVQTVPTLTSASKFNWWLIALSVVVLGLLVTLVLLYRQNQALKNQLGENPTPLTASNYEECILLEGAVIQESYPATCVAASGKRFTQEVPLQQGLEPEPVPDSAWLEYTNADLNFQVSYPSGWRVVEFPTGVGFGSGQRDENTLWNITVYQKDIYTTKAMVIAEFGKQFADRKQTVESITVNGNPVTRVVTTTASTPTWYLESIIFERGADCVTVSNGAITDEALLAMPGIPTGATFKTFYESVKLL